MKMSVEQAYLMALKSFQQNDFHLAYRYLNPIVKQVPQHLDAHFLLGLCARKLGDSNMAARILLDLLKKKRLPDYLVALGNLYVQQQQYTEAESLYKEVLERQPHHDALVNLSRVYFVQANWLAAKDALKGALAIKPGDRPSRLSYIECLRQLGEEVVALKELRIFIQQPDLSQQLIEKAAFLFFSLGSPVEATQVLATRCKMDNISGSTMDLMYKLIADRKTHCILAPWLAKVPATHPCYRQSLDICFRTFWGNERNRAFSVYEWSDLNVAGVFEDYVKKLMKCGLYEEAYRVLNSSSSTTFDVTFLKGVLALEMNAPEEAHNCFDALLEINSDDGQLLEFKAKACLASEQVNEARALMDTRLKQADLTQGSYALYGTVLKKSGDFKAYRQLFDYEHLVQFRSVDLKTNNLYEELLGYLTDLHSLDYEPFEQSLRGGSQTVGQLFESQVPVIVELKKRILRQLTGLKRGDDIGSLSPLANIASEDLIIKDSWSVLLHSGHFHANHFHNAGDYSACLYLDVSGVGQVAGEGWLKFGQAGLGEWFKDHPDFIVQPKEGLLVIFPSYMWHGTESFSGNHQRMTVAFDIKFI